MSPTTRRCSFHSLRWSYLLARCINKWHKQFFENFLYLPSATIASCNGGWAIQFPAESFICLLSEAKCRRNIGACTTRKNLKWPKLVLYVIAVNLLPRTMSATLLSTRRKKIHPVSSSEKRQWRIIFLWDHQYRVDY